MQSTVTKSGKGEDGYWRVTEICSKGVCNDAQNPGPWVEFLGKQAYRVTAPISNVVTSTLWPTDTEKGWYLIPSKDPKITKKLLYMNLAGATIEEMQNPKLWDDLTVPKGWCVQSGTIDPNTGIIPICQISSADQQRRASMLSHPRKQFQLFSFSSTVVIIVICLALGFTAIYNLMGTSKVSVSAAFGD